jgi:hypothetical protein
VPYIVVEDFKIGLDRRKKRSTGVAGSLWEATNVEITRGGEIEKRKKLVPEFQLPPGTFGLQSVGASGFYVFGSEAPVALAFPVPAGCLYQRLQHPTGLAMTRLYDSAAFAGKTYAIAGFADGSVHHFYNGTRVVDWDGGTNKPQAVGRICRTAKSSMHVLVGTTDWFSKTKDPNAFDSTQTGSGFQDFSTVDEDSGDLTAICPYQGSMAYFASNFIQLWNINEDPSKNVFVNTIGNTGTKAPKSVVPVGNTDVYYLSPSGIRSLKARDSSNVAFVSDVGNPIDTLVVSDMAALSEATIAAAQGVMEPVTGRFMESVGLRTYVFSYFPGSKVSAWSIYEFGLTIDRWMVHQGRLYARSGDVIYRYGGASGNVYDADAGDNYPATVTIPFLTAGRISDDKRIVGYDLAIEGNWEIFLLTDPRDESRYTKLGDISEFTPITQQLAASGVSTHMALRLVNRSPGPAWIGTLVVLYELDKAA